MSEQIKRVLIVDDDQEMCRLLTIGLESVAVEASSAHSVDAGLQALADCAAGHFDVILLDIAMPGREGWDLLDEIRQAGNEVPVLFISSHESTEEKVRGLRLGADDYLVKPFEFEELFARMQAIVRRRRSLSPIEVGELSLDLARRRTRRAGKDVALSPREFDLLLALVKADGEVLSRRELLRDVWDLEFDPDTNVLDVHLGRLRRKLDRHGRPSIATERGEGYRLKKENLTEV